MRTSYPFHLMIKPSGPACNLDCRYCYYTEKSELYPGLPTRMNLDTLEKVTAAYLGAHPGPEVIFGWQGGEPLLMGIEFFKKALEFQAKYTRQDQTVMNTIQTNGTLIDDKWAEFFAENDFLVGISIDGPHELHDKYRRDRLDKPSHSRVLAGLRKLQKYNVECNALVTVNRANVNEPLKVYRYLRDIGLQHIQFIPIVERQSRESTSVTPETVPSELYGDFLCMILEDWARSDIGKVYVQIFESVLNVALGNPPTMCVFAPRCGRALIVEHNGDLYACDHFVYPEHLRGSVTTPEMLVQLVDGEAQQAFGDIKADLSQECLSCPVLPYCGGDCPKHKLDTASDGKPVSYLCSAYKQFLIYASDRLTGLFTGKRYE